MSDLRIPDMSLVVLVGPSGCGKSTFARRHFVPTAVLSSDHCRGLIADDETDQTVTNEAFEILHFIASKRLAAGRMTVIDATNVQSEARRPLVALAREHDCLPVAIVFDLPESVCRERNRARVDRDFGAHVIRQQFQQMRRSVRDLKREGFRHIFHLRSVEEIEAVSVARQPLWNDKREETGPFDIIGDIHGCHDELVALLGELGYVVRDTDDGVAVTAPAGRRAVFVGDLVDRGPNSPAVLKLVMSMFESGSALCVPGNHEAKLERWLGKKNVRLTHGLAETAAQFEAEPDHFHRKVADFIRGLVSHYVLDGGNLVVAHAGLKASMHGRASGRVRQFALYGDTTGETDEFGLPVRYDWARDYRGHAMVVYGHTPVPEAEWVNRTICIDTGCVFGGKLTALRYPEKTLVSVDAQRVYYEPIKPLVPAQDERPAGLLDIADVHDKRVVSTSLMRNVTIRAENAAAALEVMSRFAVDPEWLVYLPPTMSPTATSAEGDRLEHPTTAFDYFRREGVAEVVCEEKHMGSRAVVVVCRDEEVARKRFGARDGRDGVVYSRTGRPFFPDRDTERAVLDRLRGAMNRTVFWDEFATDWAVIDTELMPWSAKARELLVGQYAAVGAASRVALDAAVETLGTAVEGGRADAALLALTKERKRCASAFVDAYREYCWDVDGVEALKLAPFHLLATEGRVHTDRDHVWHMDRLGALASPSDPLLQATAYRVVALDDDDSVRKGVAWWEALTARGGEGMVVKPRGWLARGARGLAQPAVKVRGMEYLRIIYGPEYTIPENLERMRERSLGRKRSLALRELALGIEALHRFVAREPLYRVHECVFGVLALESEPVDPRL